MTDVIFLKSKSSMKPLQAICQEFANSIGKNLNWKHWHSSVGGLVQNKIADCMVLKDGIEIVGVLAWSYFPDLITAELSATDIAWYIKPSHRSKERADKMIHAMIEKAKNRDCKNINMIALSNEKIHIMERYYKGVGFLKVETCFQKVL